MIEANEYQLLAHRTLRRDLSPRDQIFNCIFGLGEVGEVMGEYKKHFFHDHDLNREKILSEMGDVLWYLAVLALLQGFTLTDVMEYNIKKLEKRYPENEFNAERSRNRTD